jgi:hypothetical protein
MREAGFVFEVLSKKFILMYHILAMAALRSFEG